MSSREAERDEHHVEYSLIHAARIVKPNQSPSIRPSAPTRRSSEGGGVGAPTAARRHEWVVNEAPKGRWPALALHHFWTNRELIGFFALRDLRVRYKQAFLGVAWAGIQPAVGALMFTILFHRLADVRPRRRRISRSPWSASVHGPTSRRPSTPAPPACCGNSELLTKVSFPRIVPPAAALLPGFLDLAVALLLATAINIGVGGGFSAPHLLIGLPLGVLLLWPARPARCCCSARRW